MSSEAKRPTEPLESALRLTPAAANKAFAVYAVLLLVGGWIYAALSIRSDYNRTLEAGRVQVRVVAAGLEAQIGAMLNDGIGAAVAAANELDASGGVAAATDSQVSATLARMLTGGDYVRSLFIGSATRFARAGRDGKVDGGVQPAWFRTLLDPEPAGDGAIGSLIDDPDRHPHHAIPIARRLRGLALPEVWAGGLFDFHELNERYRLAIGESNVLLLLSLDGTVLVRVPNPRGVDVTKIPTKDSDMFRRAMQSPNAGVVEGIAPLLNSEAIVAYQRLNDYPLYVVAGITRDTALAGWETRRRDTLVFTAVASIVVIFMTWMLNYYVGAFRGRELHYRTLFNNAGFSAFVLDGDRFIDANRTTRSMFAVPKGETMLGMRPWEASPERQPDGTMSRELAEQRIATALDTGQAKFEWTHKRMDTDEPFPAEVELSTLRADGRTLTLAVVHDLTERKRAEQSWRESEARYRSLIEALPEAVFVHRGREPLFGNRAAAALVGAPSVAALAGYSVMSFVEEADREEVQERGRRILEEGVTAAPRPVRIKRLDGSVMWAEAEGVPVTFDGKPAVQTIVRDITARQLQEEAKAAAMERFRRQSEALLRLAARADAHVDDFRAALARICEVAAEVLSADRAEVWVLDGPQARCHASFAGGIRSVAPGRAVDSRPLSALAAALRSRRVIAVRHLRVDAQDLQLPQSGVVDAEATSALVAAIHIAGELEAFALVTHRGEPREWHDDELSFLGGIADQIAQTRLDSERERAFDELRELAGQLVRAQDEARRTIGRDLHDSTGQMLAALEVSLARLGRVTTELPPEQRRILEECIDLAGQCSAEIRTASYLLHPPLLDELGLASALRWLVDGFRDRSGIDVTLDLPASLPRLDRDSELALFRVAQEALTNVHRHSGSPSAHLSVKCGSQGIVLVIEDSGRGLPEASARSRDNAPPLSVGLAGMRERMRQIGGNVVVESGITGTRVRASLPPAPAIEMSGSA